MEDEETTARGAATLKLPWSASNVSAVKGIIHASITSELSKSRRDAILLAIAKAKSWIEELSCGLISSLAEIATREGKVERHIRSLASLAFVSPGVIASLSSGDALATLTVSGVANRLPYSWLKQQT